MMRFNDVVDVIKSLSTDEKREISLLLQQYLREESRDQIYENFQLAKQEENQGELTFSSQINQLKELLE
ncbi:hypothetical protein [Oscillatoria acuminata]|uniref:Addiction module component n=1 Tax=Oscillatoria acuminata PCC 6304 TaxID=56110 RepID=K9TES4_9CYAN|nr:hypothetical protein [Oscillatoria acuminata]AFY80908.1 hypothetical protein Oscil6304_1192 [Oscillatoria acuminata PCC 6304]